LESGIKGWARNEKCPTDPEALGAREESQCIAFYISSIGKRVPSGKKSYVNDI
jgi:hypothetical protein